MMDAAYLRSILLYAPRKGVFYWVQPPAAHAELLGEEAGSPCASGLKSYHVIQIDGVKYRRSRLAYLFMTGRDPADQIDHANGESLDDRWINLRPATPLQNAQNVKNPRAGRDLPMGVRRNASGRYAARITVWGITKQIGTYETPEEASAAYQRARLQYFGEFA